MRTIALVAVLAALPALPLGYGLLPETEPEIAPAGTLGESLAVPTGAPVFALPPEETFTGAIERPLFSPTRRPAPEPAGAAPIQGEREAQLKLVGVAAAGDLRVAVLQENGSSLHRARVGEEVAGWRVVEIARDHVLVERGSELRELALSFGEPAPGVVANSGPAVGPGPATEPGEPPPESPEVEPAAGEAGG